jgi:hypothetical protein
VLLLSEAVMRRKLQLRTFGGRVPPQAVQLYMPRDDDITDQESSSEPGNACYIYSVKSRLIKALEVKGMHT